MSLKKKSKLGLLAFLASFLLVGASAKATFAEEGETPETTGEGDGQSQTENQEEATVVYDIETKEQTKRRTYRFVVVDGTDTDVWDEQIVKNGDTLLNPATPAKDGYRFAGWIGKDGEEIDFSTEVSGIETDNEVEIVTAKFERIFVVTFLRELADEWTVYRQESGAAGEEVLADVEFPVKSDEVLAGWAESQNATEPDYELDEKIVFSEETGKFVYTLYPVIMNVKWITFESNEGTEVLPLAVKPGATIGNTLNGSSLPEPTRAGYEFEGWYEDEELTTTVDKNAAITEDKTLYAKWEAKTVQYQIFIYTEDESESATGDYHVVKTLERTGKAGTMATHSKNSIAQLVGDFENKEYYEYDTNKSETEVEILGDGSAILKVYYTRKVYTIEFDFNTRNGRGNRIYNNYEITIDGVTYKNQSGAAAPTFTAKLGQDISELWPTEIKNAENFQGWQGPGTEETLNVTKRVNLTKDMLSSTDKATKSTYTAIYGGDMEVNVEYYLENAEDTNYTKSDLSQENVRTRYNTTFNAKNIDGFMVDTTDGHVSKYELSWRDGGKTLKFYYKRNKYTLTFLGGDNALLKTETNIKHGAKITDKNFTPEAPEGQKFVGWFTDDARLNEFSFEDAEMPKHNLTLYAKFEPETFEIEFKLDADDPKSQDFFDEEENYGDSIVAPTDEPTREGYEFAGWTLLDGTPVNFEKMTVTRDMVLVAKWIDIKDKYTVVYLDEDETTELSTDDEKYIEGANAVVAECKDATKLIEKVFLGWALNDETLTPNETFEILKTLADAENKIKLIAKYGKNEDKASITYFKNDGSDEKVEDEEIVDNNHDYEIRENDFEREGYMFKEWNTEADGSGKSFAAGEMLALSNGDKNELYAIWEPIMGSIVYYCNYDDCGDAFGEDGQVMTETTIADALTREGYNFLGWSLDPEATTPDTDFDPGKIYTFVEGETELYAVWEEIKTDDGKGGVSEKETSATSSNSGLTPNTGRLTVSSASNARESRNCGLETLIVSVVVFSLVLGARGIMRKDEK